MMRCLRSTRLWHRCHALRMPSRPSTRAIALPDGGFAQCSMASADSRPWVLVHGAVRNNTAAASSTMVVRCGQPVRAVGQLRRLTARWAGVLWQSANTLLSVGEAPDTRRGAGRHAINDEQKREWGLRGLRLQERHAECRVSLSVSVQRCAIVAVVLARDGDAAVRPRRQRPHARRRALRRHDEVYELFVAARRARRRPSSDNSWRPLQRAGISPPAPSFGAVEALYRRTDLRAVGEFSALDGSTDRSCSRPGRLAVVAHAR